MLRKTCKCEQKMQKRAIGRRSLVQEQFFRSVVLHVETGA